ncbi:hypothetical protein SAMN02746065_10283 [Desulfocicer vacuolatum DSM 3385]|uniref:Uncharacterized protein n=1 Tax=Desulfocicer vacuolatum DSM 3385 TaxID=1121400 RepID=A0A1W1Z5B9_9BACT|nr:glycosyltransferase family 4 protein [Desulfocicer vacuolatum]SMC43593.1 hypothetical protein SAMN02746065_10283 [Desulfocicer vacuolatum DSM 3385]
MDFKLNKNFLNKEYSFYKKKAYECFEKDKFEKSLLCVAFCAFIAWKYPILYNFCDDDLEKILEELSKEIVFHRNINIKPVKPNKVIFYNSQIIDSGALTEQYLYYFIENEIEVLFIIPDKKYTLEGVNILKLIENSDYVELFIPECSGYVEKIKKIVEKIEDYMPQKAFLHFVPNDVVGYASFCTFEDVTKYYIVHNDHTFWLGKNCSDFFIEFRKFGYLLATNRRKISPEKIFHIPYYPIVQKINFLGLPFDRKGKVVGLSGANLNKYLLDPSLAYFYAVKKLLDRNKNFVFCLAGWGNERLIIEFIKENNLEKRFYFLGRRKDFYELVKNIDILFESYPLKGGLTVLYGTENNKPIIGIGEKRNASGCIEDFFDLNNYKQPQNIDEFFTEAEKLIIYEDERSKNASFFSNNRYRKTKFESALHTLFCDISPTPKQVYSGDVEMDDDYYLNQYINLPNSEFNYFFSKMLMLRTITSFFEKLIILYRIFLCAPSDFYLKIREKIMNKFKFNYQRSHKGLHR